MKANFDSTFWTNIRCITSIIFEGCVHYTLLICFVCLKESTCETKKNVFYFTSKALFVLDITKF